MTERQESEWLYAKGLELAILLKPCRRTVTDDTIDKIIDDEYEAIAGRIAGKIFNSAKIMTANNLI